MQRKCERNRCSPVTTDHMHLVQSQTVKKLDDVAGHRLLVEPTMRLAAVPRASEIRRDDPKLARKSWDDLAPLEPTPRETVDEHQRLGPLIAGSNVVKIDAAQHHFVVPEILTQLIDGGHHRGPSSDKQWRG